MISQSTIIIFLILAIFIIAVPRKYFLVPIIVGACFVPADQRIIIMNLDFTVLRLMLVVAFLRIGVQKWPCHFRLNRVDKLVLAWAISNAIIYSLQWLDLKACINRGGWLFDIFGIYGIFRMNIYSWAGIRLNLKIFAICSILMAFFVGIELVTGNNPFVLLGAVHTVIRESGRYRCQGSFPHSIMAGSFWATLTPLFFGLAKTEKNKKLWWCAVAASVFCTIASASSTPILVLLIAVVLLFAYSWRCYTSTFGWSLLALLVALHIVMQAPVWHLLSRVNIIGGSTGWHRYYLIDQSIKHFGEWAVLGCRSTSHWGWGLSDITNQFILEGVRGGLLSLILFLTMIYICLQASLRQSFQSKNSRDRFLAWSFWCSFIGTCVGFIGVSYFGQIIILWYMLLAIAAFFSEGKVANSPPPTLFNKYYEQK